MFISLRSQNATLKKNHTNILSNNHFTAYYQLLDGQKQ